MKQYNLHVVNGVLIADYPTALPKRDVPPPSQEVIDSMRALAAEYSHLVVTTPTGWNAIDSQLMVQGGLKRGTLNVIHAKRRPQNNEGVIVYG